MHTLVIAEKPSVARDIARVLGAKDRGENSLIGGGYVVTWALGHLVTLKEPQELDERYTRWRAMRLRQGYLPCARSWPQERRESRL